MIYLFWVSIVVIFYTYAGYPLIIYLLSLVFSKSTECKQLYPSVSIIMAVYKEEKYIESKLRTLMELEYPDEKIEILIGSSEGSSDKTDEIISNFPDKKRTIKLVKEEKRTGKCNMLNLLVSQAKGEIIVFTDARQRLEHNALFELTKYFGDQKVGSVSGELMYEKDGIEQPESGMGLYWKYENFIRESESRFGSMIGAAGAFYGFRKELFTTLPADLILDDMFVPVKVVEKGYRAIFSSKSKLYDKIFINPKAEFVRKARNLASTYQFFYYFIKSFSHFNLILLWQLFSHRFFRLMIPFLLILTFASNIFMLGNNFYGIFFLMQIIFYITALFGWLFKNRSFLLDVPCMFCVMNTAAIVGLYRFLLKKQKAAWVKADTVS
ncbi:MAG: glycosyltransferase family 2 protein [Elusimicrobia bacterium]|nr:glycosyltransferase family 2 protein [Elusimicrobiota bacterium]